jgi:polar amino acid transport system permease protein
MDLLIQSIPFVIKGVQITIGYSLLVVALSLIFGGLLGTVLCYGPAPARWAIRLYSDVIRGIPVLIVVFTVYYGLTPLGINLNSFLSAVIALTVFTTAQVVDIVRGAIQSVHFGQIEASKAIGLGFWQRMFHVVFPQALRRFLPPWINNVTDVVKGSTLISFFGIVDLMLALQQVIGRVYEPMPLYILGCIIYFAINFSLSSLSRTLEARYAYIRE